MQLLVTISTIAFSQTVSISPAPTINTKCPDELTTYTASITNRSGCTFTWSSSDGEFFNNKTTGSEIKFTWNDSPVVGKLKVTVTCGSGEAIETFPKEEEYIIRSINNVSPQNFRLSIGPLPICNNITTMLAMVDKIYVPNS